jgi:hypothetical protein
MTDGGLQWMRLTFTRSLPASEASMLRVCRRRVSTLHQLLGKATFLTLLIHLHALCLLVAWAAVNCIHRVEVRFVCEATAQGWNVGLGREKCLHDTNLIRWLRARHRVPRSFTYIHHSFHFCVEQRC